MIYSTEDLELSKSNVCKSKNYPETLHSFLNLQFVNNTNALISHKHFRQPLCLIRRSGKNWVGIYFK